MTRHLFALGAIFLFLVSTSCSGALSTSIDPSYCQDTIETVASLPTPSNPSLDFLRGLVDGTAEGFDVNEYFSVLTHLSMEDGYSLGYLYYLEEDFGGMPILQAWPSQYATYAEYIKAEDPDLPPDPSFLDHVRTDGTKEGFFEFVVLDTLGGQFYLYWHSAVAEIQFLCNQASLREFLDAKPRLPPRIQWRARSLDVRPVVKMQDDIVLVQIVIFSDWGGFIRESYTISRDYPHRVLEKERETLIEYDSSIQF